MMELEFALGEVDQKKYDKKYDGPEWLGLDVQALNDTPWSVMAPWEREMKRVTGKTITELLVAGLDSDDADGKKAIIWLSRVMAGVPTPSFEKFDILPRRIRKRVVGEDGDADPPSSGSSEPSSADETSTQG